MRLPEPPRRGEGENVIPLINVVFLLLIFFMIAGSLGRTELFRVEPPESASEAPLPPEARRVLLADDGRLALDGRAVSLEQLGSALDGGAAPVEIKADGGAHAAKLMAVLAAVREAGIEEVELITVRDRDG
ncbi:biopolymer transporter ExbD [Ectothiorhodospiraceae bacterium WFHF3C12]|nr:biopolymer transporter ExbD [Ectothiorhodospiraceae bacterium WFHF3C12]